MKTVIQNRDIAARISRIGG